MLGDPTDTEGSPQHYIAYVSCRTRRQGWLYGYQQDVLQVTSTEPTDELLYVCIARGVPRRP